MYTYLYDLCVNKKSSVHEVVADGWVIGFKIRLQ
jgi:hypothetical protein